MTGLFVVVEGPEGVGKSTLARSLADRLERRGVAVVSVREPGGTPAAEHARAALLDPSLDLAPNTELLFLTAARAHLVQAVIRPALADGKVVLSDRFDLSTMAYQVAGRGLQIEQVIAVNDVATGGLRPDVTLVLDAPVATGRQRQHDAGKAQDRFEREPADFHERVAAFYRRASGPGVHHLDATRHPDEVLDAAVRVVVKVLEGRTAVAGH